MYLQSFTLARYGSARYAYELDLPNLSAYTLQRFPYVVFYVPKTEYVHVWRVLHEMRDIPGWLCEGQSGRRSS